MWTAIFCVSSVILCCLCLLGCVLNVQSARQGSESQRRLLRSCVSRLESLEESAELSKTELERLANRVKMQRVRNATDHATSSRPDGEPDPAKDPAGWRDWKNRQLKTGVVN